MKKKKKKGGVHKSGTYGNKEAFSKECKDSRFVIFIMQHLSI